MNPNGIQADIGGNNAALRLRRCKEMGLAEGKHGGCMFTRIGRSDWWPCRPTLDNREVVRSTRNNHDLAGVLSGH